MTGIIVVVNLFKSKLNPIYVWYIKYINAFYFVYNQLKQIKKF